jgi:hypothetical protein
MPSSKKHVYLGKTNDLILIFFFLKFGNFLKDAGDSTFNQNLRQLTVFLFIAII